MTYEILLRSPCACGATTGSVTKVGTSNVVRCLQCQKWLYNAPKIETGERPPGSKDLHKVGRRNGLRQEVFSWAKYKCELCGSDQKLHLSHRVSVANGLKQGLLASEINHPRNLLCLCASCNLHQHAKDITPEQWNQILAKRESQ